MWKLQVQASSAFTAHGPLEAASAQMNRRDN